MVRSPTLAQVACFAQEALLALRAMVYAKLATIAFLARSLPLDLDHVLAHIIVRLERALHKEHRPQPS
jgi:hypothetical protein